MPEKLDVHRLAIDDVARGKSSVNPLPAAGRRSDFEAMQQCQKSGSLSGSGSKSRKRKIERDRMAAMLSRLGGRGYQVGEDSGMYDSTKNDFDPDSDPDPDRDPGGW